MSIPTDIIVWACPTCGYWRSDETTGRHQTANPADPNGRMVTHALVRVVYVRDEQFDDDEPCAACGGEGNVVVNPDWPRGTEPHTEKCGDCGGSR